MEIVIGLFALIICLTFVALNLSNAQVDFPFSVKKQLFTATERQFLNLIEQAVGSEFRVLCRVKLIDLLALKNNTKRKIASGALSRASNKQLDFVLCDRNDMTPVMAIDLVYGMGKDGHKVQRDYFVNGALDTASIPHVRIKAKNGYSIAEVRDCIEAKLIPLRRKQGKVPFTHSSATENSILTPNKRPTRPLRTNRKAAA